MRKTKLTVKPTTQFKKDFKLAMKRGLKIKLLEDVIAALAMSVSPQCSAGQSGLFSGTAFWFPPSR